MLLIQIVLHRENVHIHLCFSMCWTLGKFTFVNSTTVALNRWVLECRKHSSSPYSLNEIPCQWLQPFMNPSHAVVISQLNTFGFLTILQEKADVAAKEADTAKAAWLCRVCLIAEVDITIVPCGHVLCRRCSSAVSRCPFCRLQVSKTIRIFRPWNRVHWWCSLLLSFQFLQLQLKIVHGPWDSFVSCHNILSISPFIMYIGKANSSKTIYREYGSWYCV